MPTLEANRRHSKRNGHTIFHEGNPGH
ncbi:MAG: hypothetical protein ACJAUC_005009, partial [Planctomycetota bacterium]